MFVVQDIIYATRKQRWFSVEMEVQESSGDRKTWKFELERKKAISLSPVCDNAEASLDWCSISVTPTVLLYRASFTGLKEFPISFFHLVSRLG